MADGARRREAPGDWARALRVAIVCGLGLSVALASGGGCLYPSDYTFDELTPTGQGGAGGGGGVGGGTTSGGTGEDCLNGVDDDGDKAVDCADSECSAQNYQCITTAPVGWTGYFALHTGPTGVAPECPADFPSTIPYTGMSGLVAFQAACEKCSCGLVQNEVCDLPNFITVFEKTCGNAASAVSPKDLSVPMSWDGSCHAVGNAAGAQVNCGAGMNEKCNTSVKADAPTVTLGSCTPSGGGETIEPVTWMVMGKACGNAPIGGGCGGGQVCQPPPTGDFKPGLCIYKDGEQDACPGEPFTVKHVFYSGVEDTRDCVDCSCDAPKGGKCTANITVYSDANCTANPTTFNAGSCGSLPAANLPVFGREATGITVTPGTCQAKGGTPTGSVVPTGATTFCCIP